MVMYSKENTYIICESLKQNSGLNDCEVACSANQPLKFNLQQRSEQARKSEDENVMVSLSCDIKMNACVNVVA